MPQVPPKRKKKVGTTNLTTGRTRGGEGVTAADRAKVKQSTGGLGGLADLARKEKARRAGTSAQGIAARLQKESPPTPAPRAKPAMKNIRLPARRSSSRSH